MERGLEKVALPKLVSYPHQLASFGQRASSEAVEQAPRKEGTHPSSRMHKH